MEPNLPNNEAFVINFLAHKIFGIKRYDVLVIKDDEGDEIVKRIVGLPNEKVKMTRGVIYIDGKKRDYPSVIYDNAVGMTIEEITLKKGEYFYIGDNRGNTYFGVARKKDVVGFLR